MKLYTYWRSSAAYRVRIGLNLKGQSYDHAYVHLVKDGGQHLQAAYKAINPQSMVPSLALDDGTVLTQSLAILEFLDEVYPEPAFLPADPVARAQARAMALLIAADIHPVNNLRVLKYIVGQLGADEATKATWYKHWICEGFTPLEHMLAAAPHHPFCCGDMPTLADICLVPQVYNAQRFGVNMDAFPHIQRISNTCQSLHAFHAAAPEQQADAA
jgi:maleylacetoacetate isomerase